MLSLGTLPQINTALLRRRDIQHFSDLALHKLRGAGVVLFVETLLAFLGLFLFGRRLKEKFLVNFFFRKSLRVVLVVAHLGLGRELRTVEELYLARRAVNASDTLAFLVC